MRFIVLVKASKESEQGQMPSKELLESMGRFNEEMAKAGVMLAGEGLKPSSEGCRIKFSGGKQSVIDGPFPETKELVAGFWIIKTNSREEAIEWIKKAPFGGDDADGPEIEIRPIYEFEDFAADVLTPQEAEKERALRAELDRRTAQV